MVLQGMELRVIRIKLNDRLYPKQKDLNNESKKMKSETVSIVYGEQQTIGGRPSLFEVGREVVESSSGSGNLLLFDVSRKDLCWTKLSQIFNLALVRITDKWRLFD